METLAEKIERKRREKKTRAERTKKRMDKIVAAYDAATQRDLMNAVNWVYAGYMARYDDELGKLPHIQACEANAAYYIRQAGI